MVDYYPSENNIYANGFVHTRVLKYINEGHDVDVYCLSDDNSKDYKYESVRVKNAGKEKIKEYINSEYYDAIFTHMPGASLMKILLDIDDIRIVLWLHGSSSVWTFYLYPYDGSNLFKNALRLINRFRMDLIRRVYLKKMIQKKNTFFVFVSEWMKDHTERFVNYKFNKNYSIIYNPVDEDIFTFKLRTDKIKDVVCVRPHKSSKYALDLVIKAFSNSKYTVHIYGDGPYFEKNKKLAEEYKSNVVFHKRFFTQKELGKLYQDYNLGIMLSRLDAQGVSACEMQMTGLPIITSDIIGNEEFKTRGMFRIKNNNYSEIEGIIDQINENDNIEELSKLAYEDIYSKLNIENIIKRELQILESFKL